jgi:hypothetical protein
LFKLLNGDNLDVVEIFNSDRTHHYAILETIPSKARKVPDDTTVTLVEQGAGQPDVLLTWFYPGSETGHEFIYSNQLEKQIAQDKQQNVIANQPAATSEAGGSH